MLIVSQDGNKLFFDPKSIVKKALWQDDPQTHQEVLKGYVIEVDGVRIATYSTEEGARGWLEKLQDAYYNERHIFNFY